MQNSGLQILGLTLGHVPNPVGILEPQMQFAWKGKATNRMRLKPPIAFVCPGGSGK